MHGIKFLLQNRYCASSSNIAYPPALDWTMKFCRQNFSLPNLFPNLRLSTENWSKLSPNLIAKYLPSLKYSVCVAVIESKKFVDPVRLSHVWKRFKLFEADLLENGTSMFFCGGPIFALAWAPTPYDQQHCEQILAISADCNIHKGYTLGEVYLEPGLIQFWNCGAVLNDTPAVDMPLLEFCIAHDHGPVWCLEWCPSGCFDALPNFDNDCFQRLGVLAVGSSNSCIYLYFVCRPKQTSGKIFKPKPSLKLVLESVVEDTASNMEAHVTKISWSKAAGHQFLAAGYANGLVAVFDLNTTSSLLKLGNDENGIETLMPYRVFNAHYYAVTALHLYHLNDGCRWLMTASTDRNIKYWDLENPLVPITNFTKFIVTDGAWLNHWLSTVHCYDDSCGGGLTSTVAHQLRNFESESTSVMHSNSRVNTISGSDWGNGFVQGNVVGEIKGIFLHQMFYSMDGDKSYRNKKVILGYARLVEKKTSNNQEQQLEKAHKPHQKMNVKAFLPNCLNPEPTTYKEAEEKYGLVFCDTTPNTIKEFPTNISNYFASNKLDKLYPTKPNVYPMQSITKVALNPNRESFSYLASGYQAGFVRISCLRFLVDSTQY